MAKINIDASQSLSFRAMSFDITTLRSKMEESGSQSLSIRAMSFDGYNRDDIERIFESQSLSIRAMSFDLEALDKLLGISKVSIPFDQGNVFRRNEN